MMESVHRQEVIIIDEETGFNLRCSRTGGQTVRVENGNFTCLRTSNVQSLVFLSLRKCAMTGEGFGEFLKHVSPLASADCGLLFDEAVAHR